MSIKECIKLAAYNIIRKKTVSFQIAISFLIVSFIGICSVSYILFLNSEISSLYEKEISRCYISIPKEELSDKKGIFSEEKLESIEGVVDINLLSSLSPEELIDNIPKRNEYAFLFRFTKLITNGREYSANKSSINDRIIGDYISIDKYSKDYPTVSENEIKELFNVTKIKKPFLFGKEFDGNNQVILSELLLDKYGFSKEDMEKIIGSKISMAIYDVEGNNPIYLFKDYHLVGVFTSEFFNVKSRSDSSHILISSNTKSFNVSDYDKIIVNVKEFSNVKNVYDKIQSTLGIEGEYSSTCEFYMYLNNINLVLKSIFTLASFIICFAIIMNVVILTYFNVNKKRNYLGMLKAMGLSPGRITFILFSELAFIGVVSIVYASLFAAILIKASLGVFEKMLYIEVVFHLDIIFRSIMSTGMLLLFVVLFIMLFIYIKVISKTSNTLLNRS
ncbi:MAG TPA: ABC transporter permease [Clostridium sp.]|nr:ABC transporter permease [Clostridium sp.]